MRENWPKLGVVAAVLLGLLLAYRLGVFSSFADARSLAASIRDLGVWGYVLFIVAYAVFQPFGVPGTVFIVAAPLIWSWPVAFVLSMTGTMAASVIGFSFARFVARDWVSKRIPARFKKWEERLERNGFRTVFLLRFLFWMPPPLHAFLGISRVRFWTHFWGSFFGYIAPILIVSVLGNRLFDDAGHWRPLSELISLREQQPQSPVLAGARGGSRAHSLRGA